MLSGLGASAVRSVSVREPSVVAGRRTAFSAGPPRKNSPASRQARCSARGNDGGRAAAQVASALEQEMGAPALLIPFGQASDACHLANERIARANLLAGKNVRPLSASTCWRPATALVPTAEHLPFWRRGWLSSVSWLSHGCVAIAWVRCWRAQCDRV